MLRRCSTMFAVVLVAMLGSASNAQIATDHTLPPGLELQISGPRLIRRGEKLRFTGKILNHSANPVAFALRQGGWDCDGAFRWKITDTREQQLPPLRHDAVPGMVCCLTSHVSEDELIVLNPGEELALSGLSDPSDFFTFPRNGFYRVSLRFIFDPYITDVRQVKAGSRWEEAVKTGRVDVWSNEWHMYLTD